MSQKKTAQIALTFDLEYWYSGIYLKKYLSEDHKNLPDIYQSTTEKILNLLDKHQIKVTFFVLGKLASENTQLIKRIHRTGHEIAIHGYDHKIVSEMTLEQFNQDLQQTKKIIFKITGQEPIGYRAPNFLQPEWLPEKLIENNIKYDSSVFPQITKISKHNINRPYYIKKNNGNLLEFPISIYNFYGFKIPASGGFYFRIIPLPIFKILFNKIINKYDSAVLYFHPMDLENFKPKIKIPFLLKTLKYWGVKKSFAKFDKFLKTNKNNQFITLTELYEKNLNNHSNL